MESSFTEIFARGWGNFLARTKGPLNFRFFLQPGMAALLAIRSGLRDASEGRPAFFWSLVFEKSARADRAKQGIHEIGKVTLVALSLDFVYQLIVNRGVYFLELLFTAFILAVVPYLLIRGPVNRMARRTKG